MKQIKLYFVQKRIYRKDDKRWSWSTCGIQSDPEKAMQSAADGYENYREWRLLEVDATILVGDKK